MLDLRTGSVMQTFPDIQNFRLPAASLISPCGTWVLGGSHCGVSEEAGGGFCQEMMSSLMFQVGLVWDTDTGTKHHMVRDPVYDCQVNTGLPLVQSDLLSLNNFRFLLLHFIRMSMPWQLEVSNQIARQDPEHQEIIENK